MSVRHLDHLFQPRSVAVIGASERPGSLGAIVMRNLAQAGFAGPVWPVNLRHRRVLGQPAWRRVAELPQAPELAVVCTPARTVPGLIAELGEKGCKAAVVLSAGLQEPTPEGGTLQARMLAAARPHLLRILGPNCVGLLVPPLGLNASFAHLSPRPGGLAFLSQSGALTTALLDWADSRAIGFSHFVSMGDCADVDFGDALDWLASDPGTRAILMYMESVTSPRKFLSAARAAARNKPVLVVKAGRAPEGARAAASHTGALAGADDVFDAAVRRAGMLRVDGLLELFDAAETLARARAPRGDALTIVTNGGGAGVLAADAVALQGGRLAGLAAPTREALDAVLPATWSHANPVDLIGDAPVRRYVQALDILLSAPQTEALLFIHAPTAIVPSAEIASACAGLLADSGRTVLTSWLGGSAVAEARRLCAAAGLPTYDTPEQAVSAWLQLVRFRENQEALMQTPPSLPGQWSGDPAQEAARARRILAQAAAAGESMLSEPEAKEVLAAYGIPVVPSRLAPTPQDAAQAAREIGFPVALKIVSPQVSHKSDVGGVALNLESAEAVADAARAMQARLTELRPDARLCGFSVQAMVRRPHAHELIVGVATDPVFGPVILFGQGGTAVEVVRDRAVALPPLNMLLARDLVSRTRVSRLLAGWRDRAAVDHEALCLVLLKVSQMVCDLGEIAELDINPLLADDHGVVALDARIRLGGPAGEGRDRLAIRPYPAELESRAGLPGGREVLLRPIRPEDEPALRRFYAEAPPQDLCMRFFVRRDEVPPSELARHSQIDYDREMTLVAFDPADEVQATLLGYACALADPDNVEAEFAVQVSAREQRRGLATALLERLIDHLRARGTQRLVGVSRADNAPMLSLARRLGFELEREEGQVNFRMRLDSGP